MDVLDINKLHLFFVFAVPGIILIYIRSIFLDGRMPNFVDNFVSYVVVSLIYNSIWFLIFPDLYSAKLESVDLNQKLIWIAVVFVIPALLGFIMALNVRMGWLSAIASKFGMPIVHPVQSAWDWRFSTLQESWALIVLKDGTKWGGVLGEDSFISSSVHERDVFMQKVYVVDDEGSWHERDSSVLITHDQIQSIEFWKKGNPNV